MEKLKTNIGFIMSSTVIAGQSVMCLLYLFKGMNHLTHLAFSFASNPNVNKKDPYMFNILVKKDSTLSTDFLYITDIDSPSYQVNDTNRKMIQSQKDFQIYQNNSIINQSFLFSTSLFLHNTLLKPFCGLSKYESFMFNCSILIFTVSSTIVLNALLFSNEQISKKFTKKLTFRHNFIRGFYASLIQIVITRLVKMITNYYSLLAMIIQDTNDNKKIPTIMNKFTMKIKYKIILFFIIEIVCSILSGLYLSTFLNIYKNTLVTLLIGSLISLLLSIVYSVMLCICLIITTICGIKYEILILYKISLFLQCLVLN